MKRGRQEKGKGRERGKGRSRALLAFYHQSLEYSEWEVPACVLHLR